MNDQLLKENEFNGDIARETLKLLTNLKIFGQSTNETEPSEIEAKMIILTLFKGVMGLI
jgi:hypothetical protein